MDKRDSGNEKWQFNVANIRIPIYMSLCPREGWIDLGDGTDGSLLSSYIQDCIELDDVINWLDIYWIPGQHISEIKPITANKYTFSAGTLANEEYHIGRLKYATTKAINDTIDLLRTDEYKFSKDDYPCPEDVINAKAENVRNLVTAGYYKWPSKLGGTTEAEEIDSDKSSTPVFRQIRLSIIDWARQQSWWDVNSVWCKEAISGH